MLNSEGRVVLKIYDAKNSLMISRPCASPQEAETWFTEYVKAYSHAAEYTHSVTPMVPRI